MSVASRRRQRPSTPNIAIVVTCAVGAVAAGLLQNVPGTVLLALLAIGFTISALLGRRPQASDWMRVNAIEYRDERDVELAGRGFTVVGAWALGLSLAQLVIATLLVGAVGPDIDVRPIAHGVIFRPSPALSVAVAAEILSAVQVLVLNIIWGIANTRAVRRG